MVMLPSGVMCGVTSKRKLALRNAIEVLPFGPPGSNFPDTVTPEQRAKADEP
jgi:hypothetical protein